MSRILLAISYVASNSAVARRTIQEYGDYFRRNAHARHDVLLGVETRAEQRAELEQFGHLFPELYVWDDDATVRALEALNGRPQPFSSGFSYGGTLNRVLVLSRLAGCDYLLRVDPGTVPPGDLWGMLETQQAALQTRRVVSGVYQGRLAFRDNLYARRSLRDEYLAFIAQRTGIAVHRQITGGALFMMASPGVPAICFAEWSTDDPTLVWGSDDGIFQDCGIESQVFAEHQVPRHDPVGKAKAPIEYFRGIAGMVYLNHLRHNGAARASVGSFVRHLGKFLDPSLPENEGFRFPLKEDEVAPSRFLDAIDLGYANHLRLAVAWREVVDALARTVAVETLALRKP
jgi:hypothetical protein